MNMRTKNAYYELPREDVMQRLGLKSSANATGNQPLFYTGWHGQVEIELSDYPCTQHPFRTSTSIPPHLIGTRAEFTGPSSADLDRAHTALDRQIDKFKLSSDQLRVPQLQAMQVRLVIDQQISDILRSSKP